MRTWLTVFNIHLLIYKIYEHFTSNRAQQLFTPLTITWLSKMFSKFASFGYEIYEASSGHGSFQGLFSTFTSLIIKYEHFTSDRAQQLFTRLIRTWLSKVCFQHSPPWYEHFTSDRVQ